mmetsp:Transcript_7528/g.14025  ORF Transcript_7528/g.14025 Transcript_7528/m.14025 type:complete len:203 (-) Transcript_7528:721-1329(-)
MHVRCALVQSRFDAEPRILVSGREGHNLSFALLGQCKLPKIVACGRRISERSIILLKFVFVEFVASGGVAKPEVIPGSVVKRRKKPILLLLSKFDVSNELSPKPLMHVDCQQALGAYRYAQQLAESVAVFQPMAELRPRPVCGVLCRCVVRLMVLQRRVDDQQVSVQACLVAVVRARDQQRTALEHLTGRTGDGAAAVYCAS